MRHTYKTCHANRIPNLNVKSYLSIKTIDDSVLGWINAISHHVHKYLTNHGFSPVLMFFSSLIGLEGGAGSGRLHSQECLHWLAYNTPIKFGSFIIRQ